MGNAPVRLLVAGWGEQLAMQLLLRALDVVGEAAGCINAAQVLCLRLCTASAFDCFTMNMPTSM